jgi:hypothetical protein
MLLKISDHWLHKLRTDGVICVNKLTPGAILGCDGIKEYHIKYYQKNKEVLKIQGAKYKQAHKKYRKIMIIGVTLVQLGY